MTRVALYARYSSDNQRDASIEDQFRICREHAKREKWKVISTYKDTGISGASMILLPSIQTLLKDLRLSFRPPGRRHRRTDPGRPRDRRTSGGARPPHLPRVCVGPQRAFHRRTPERRRHRQSYGRQVEQHHVAGQCPARHRYCEQRALRGTALSGTGCAI